MKYIIQELVVALIAIIEPQIALFQLQGEIFVAHTSAL